MESRKIEKIGPFRVELGDGVMEEMGMDIAINTLKKELGQEPLPNPLPDGERKHEPQVRGGYMLPVVDNAVVTLIVRVFADKIKGIRAPLLKSKIPMDERLSIAIDRDNDEVAFSYSCWHNKAG